MSFYNDNKDNIFKKYSNDELLRDINNYIQRSGRLSKVLNQFFEEIIFECKGARGSISPMDALHNDEIINQILEYTKSKPKFYTGNDISNIKSFFRNGGKTAQKVANFCPKNARSIYFRYFDINGDKINVLDTSAGFGSRMSSVLLYNHNYCGFDPNVKLFNQLNVYYNWLKENNITTGYCKLICDGSENFHNELCNKFDVSFTSPPYFNLEYYSNDNGQSIEKFNTYQLWLENFVKPTILNTYKYLKVGGYAMINIKNLTRGHREPLFDDWFNIFSQINDFEFVEVFEMEHQSKKNYIMNTNYSKEKYTGFKEPIMVFKKVR